MKRFFQSLLAIFFPWIVLLIYDNPGGALLALVLQGSMIGWIPASIWAWRIVHKNLKPKEREKMKRNNDAR